MNKQEIKRILASLLVMVMMINILPIQSAAAGNQTELKKNSIIDQLFVENTTSAEIDPEQFVTVIIELDTATTLEVPAYAEAYRANSTGFSADAGLAVYRENLISQQESIQGKIAENIPNALFRYSYTNLINGFAAYVQYKDIAAIEKLDGVRSVYISQQYELDNQGAGEDEQVEFTTLEGMASETGLLSDKGSIYQLRLQSTWDKGYTGAGKVAAIFDSGYYSENQLFQYYNEQNMMDTYGLTRDTDGGTIRTKEGIAQVLAQNSGTMNLFVSKWTSWFHSWPEQYPDDLYQSGFGDDVAAQVESGAYYTNMKSPFNVDYANGDFNTWTEFKGPEAFIQPSDHGAHVAGITAGNAGPENPLNSVVKGSAFDAQIFFFKVFKEQDGVGQEGDEDVFAALDDAVTLGVNSFNLSLGIPHGFTTYNTFANAGYQRAYNCARNAGISIALSAGNDGRDSRSGMQVNGYTTVLPNSSKVGVSGSLFSPTCVASAQGVGYQNMTITTTTEASVTVGQTELVKLSLTDNNLVALGTAFKESLELVYGGTKAELTALAEKGGKSFDGKAVLVVLENTIELPYTIIQSALDLGAKVAIVASSDSAKEGTLSPNYLQVGPAYGIAKAADGKTIIDQLKPADAVVPEVPTAQDTSASATEDNAQVLEKMFVKFTSKTENVLPKESVYKDVGPVGSTSWGVTEALRLKPEIMAPGGSILSAGTGSPTSLSVKSGTSMATPNFSGCHLLVQQYLDSLIKSGDVNIKSGTLEYSTIVDALLASTAKVYQPFENKTSTERLPLYFSPRRQGAGLAQVDQATNSRVYLHNDMPIGYNLLTGESQRTKVELGDKLDTSFAFTFVVENLDSAPHTYNVQSCLQSDKTTLQEDGRYTINSPNSYGADIQEIAGAVMTVKDVTGNGTKVSGGTNINRYASNVDNGAITVNGKSSAKVTISVTLNAAEMAAYDAMFPNGMFLDGFVFLKDTTKSEYAVDLNIPFMGFRGDWTAAPIFDFTNTYKVTKAAVSDLNYPLYYIDNLHSRITDSDTGAVKDLVLGANQFTGAEVPQFNSTSNVVKKMRDYLGELRADGNLNEDWIAFSPNGDGQTDTVYAQIAIMRNAKMFGVQILNHEGKVVRDLGTEYEYYSILPSDANLSHLVQTTGYDKYNHKLLWDGLDDSGNKAPDGQYSFKVSALLEYDYLKLLNEDATREACNAYISSLDRTNPLVGSNSELKGIYDKTMALVETSAKELLKNSKHTFAIPVKIDTVAPVVSKQLTGTTLTVSATDAVGVQAIAAFYEGVPVAATVMNNQDGKDCKNCKATFTLAAGQTDISKITAQAVDYAMNLTTDGPLQGVLVLPIESKITVGQSVTLTATPSVGKDQVVTYQWYSKSTLAEKEAWVAIENATSSTFTPDTSTVGTRYYHCVATCGTIVKTSNSASVAVSAAPPSPGGGGGGGGGTTTPTTPPMDKTTVVETSFKPAAKTEGTTAEIKVSQAEMDSLIAQSKKAETDAKKDGSKIDAIITITPTISASASGPVGTVKMELPVKALLGIVSGTTASLKVATPVGTIALNPAALTAIANAATGTNVILSVEKVAAGLDTNATVKDLLAAGYPVFEISILSEGKKITGLGTGLATILLPYTLKADEKADGLVIVYIDDKGVKSTMPDSKYADGNLSCTTNHLSWYGIEKVAQKTTFTDVTAHWAKEAIHFVVEKGLFNGTSETTFSPDAAMTRGMLVTVIARMADATSATTIPGFVDVPSDAFYAQGAAWASKAGIVSGVGNNRFAPLENITREQLCVMLENYAEYAGKTVPRTGAAAAADAARISPWAQSAVIAMQDAGILTGKPGNLLDPQGMATRAEVATILQRFIQVVK